MFYCLLFEGFSAFSYIQYPLAELICAYLILPMGLLLMKFTYCRMVIKMSSPFLDLALVPVTVSKQ